MTDKKICFHINTIIINIYSNIFLKVPVSPPDLSVKRPNLKRSKTLGLSSIDNNSYNLEVKSPLSNGKTIAQKILFSHIPTLFVSISQCTGKLAQWRSGSAFTFESNT